MNGQSRGLGHQSQMAFESADKIRSGRRAWGGSSCRAPIQSSHTLPTELRLHRAHRGRRQASRSHLRIRPSSNGRPRSVLCKAALTLSRRKGTLRNCVRSPESPTFGVFPKQALHDDRYNPRLRPSNGHDFTRTVFLGQSVRESFNFNFREPRIEANACILRGITLPSNPNVPAELRQHRGQAWSPNDRTRVHRLVRHGTDGTWMSFSKR